MLNVLSTDLGTYLRTYYRLPISDCARNELCLHARAFLLRAVERMKGPLCALSVVAMSTEYFGESELRSITICRLVCSYGFVTNWSNKPAMRSISRCDGSHEGRCLTILLGRQDCGLLRGQSPDTHGRVDGWPYMPRASQILPWSSK